MWWSRITGLILGVPDAPPRIQWGTALVLLIVVPGTDLIASLLRRARLW